ncbi:hypothetical protein [Burkholderia anthina]|uniref:hypothetical protein n=1 Tax=Burkholderia anthina TaxID=179879 RepID=UPI0037C07351
MKSTHDRLMDDIVELEQKRVRGEDTLSLMIPWATKYPIDPLEANMSVAASKKFVDNVPPYDIAWMCIPSEKRLMALKAFRAGKDTFVDHLNAKDTRATVMQMLVALFVASNPDMDPMEGFLDVVKVAMDPKPEARKQIAHAIGDRMLKDGMVRVHHEAAIDNIQQMTLWGEVGVRYSLIQIALLAMIVHMGPEKGPRCDEVHELVTRLIEIHGDRARHQLSPQVMNPLIWQAESGLAAQQEAPRSLHASA